MGIPFYFKEIVSQNKNILTNLNKCNRLYLDYNSIIHTSAYKVVTTKIWNNYDSMEKAIFQNIINYTYEVINSCKPDQLLYIGIDGVAPLAKMIQQRKRRHLSALQNSLINNFKRNNNIPYTEWDSNCITPGTEFMKKLTIVLKEHFSSTNPFQVIISGPDEKGEGEHKIIQYIKELGDDKCLDVIYGLDADLIMLSLTCNKTKLFLMRENSQITSHRGKGHNLGFKFVNIDALRASVSNFLYPEATNYTLHMNDYVFICFLLGNDFLPHFISLDIKYEGLHIICNEYRKVYEQLKENLIQNIDGTHSINMKFLNILLANLSQSEDTRIKKNINSYFDTPYFEKPYSSQLEKFVNDLNFMPIIKRKKVIDPDNDMFWKATYYKTLLNLSYSNIKEVDEICKNYIDGLNWNVNYYFNIKSSNKWYYKYTTAPFLSDISKFIIKNENYESQYLQQHLQQQDIEIIDKEQLLLVLPHKSLNLIPKYQKQKIDNIEYGYSHLYPISFQVCTFLKTQLWECIPVLPNIDIEKVKSII
jgi:5'-3' exonuclease